MINVYVVTSGSSYDRNLILACENEEDALACSKIYNGDEKAEEHVRMLPLVMNQPPYVGYRIENES